MKKRVIKGTDLNVSNICYGTANFGEYLTKQEAFQILDAFLSAGGNFIDTANVYCRWVKGFDNISEQYLGEWLKERNAYQRVVVATKGGHYDFSDPARFRIRKKEIQHDLEESLKTLGLSCIDFYWLHRDDPMVPAAEILGIMEELKAAGKIRYYGASNWSMKRAEEARQISAKEGISGFTAISNQWSMAEMNPNAAPNADPTLVRMDEEYYAWHLEHQIPSVPYSAGAHGFFDKLKRSALTEELKQTYVNPLNMKRYQQLCAEQERTGSSLYALSLAWLVAQPFQVFPTVSVSRLAQIADLITAGTYEWKEIR